MKYSRQNCAAPRIISQLIGNHSAVCACVCLCAFMSKLQLTNENGREKITHGLKQCKTMIYIPNKYLSKINGSPPFFFGFFSTLSTCSPCSSTTNILFNSYKCRECRRIMNMNIQEVQAESARENVFISLQISSSSRCCWAQLFSHFACISLDFVKWIYAKIITWHWPISGKKLSYVSTEKRQNRMVIRNYEHISCFFSIQQKFQLHIWLEFTKKNPQSASIRW